jgi:hypothetical protein
MRGIWIVALLIGTTAARADCDHFKWSVAQEKAWFAQAPEPVDAGGEIALGHAYEVALKPEDKAEFIEPPKKQTPGAYGGVLKLNIDKPGLYQITLSREAWVDVLQGGVKARTKNVSRQRDCASFVKSVRFDLAAGALALEVSAATAPSLTLSLAPAP